MSRFPYNVNATTFIRCWYRHRFTCGNALHHVQAPVFVSAMAQWCTFRRPLMAALC